MTESRFQSKDPALKSGLLTVLLPTWHINPKRNPALHPLNKDAPIAGGINSCCSLKPQPPVFVFSRIVIPLVPSSLLQNIGVRINLGVERFRKGCLSLPDVEEWEVGKRLSSHPKGLLITLKQHYNFRWLDFTLKANCVWSWFMWYRELPSHNFARYFKPMIMFVSSTPFVSNEESV